MLRQLNVFDLYLVTGAAKPIIHLQLDQISWMRFATVYR